MPGQSRRLLAQGKFKVSDPTRPIARFACVQTVGLIFALALVMGLLCLSEV